jgi:transposase-like protein
MGVEVDAERFWLVGAVDPDINVILHLRLYPSRTTVALFHLGLHFRHETVGEWNPVERVFQEIKRRTEQFYNTFPRQAQIRLINGRKR